MPRPIEDYGLVGDGETAALIGRDGSVDWLCWPRFDSGACFAALLGDTSHGAWRIWPADGGCEVRRRYLDDSLVLETVFESDAGAVALLDFMPPRSDSSSLVRIVEGRGGVLGMRMHLNMRFDYGAATPWVTRPDPRSWCAIAGPHLAALHASTELKGDDDLEAAFELRAGERQTFVLSYGPSHLPMPPRIDAQAALASTRSFWRGWSRSSEVEGRYEAVMRRSLVTLKALIYAPTGGLIASPTTSLPEASGGVRNWDYRYCWLRDAALALLALINTGHTEEARQWASWLRRAVGGAPGDLQIVYGAAGERGLLERDIPTLPGYEGARPVRVGNAAHRQFQLDVYGELMDALHQARRVGLLDEASWPLERGIVEHVTQSWRRPDAGIWEERGRPRHYTFSKVMAWVALDRGVRAIEEHGLPGPRARWRTIREQIRADVLANGFDAERQRFMRAYDDPNVDASLLLIGDLGFVSHDDRRFVTTIEAIERDLLPPGGLLRRYDTEKVDDGLPPGEAAFLPCSFWLANAYVMLGRTAEAEELFERLLALCNDVGLLSEEFDTARWRFAGNFPQAFSHVGLLNTAMALTRRSFPSRQRAGGSAPTGSETVAATADADPRATLTRAELRHPSDPSGG